MSSEFLHDLHVGSDDFVFDTVPGGSVGNLLRGVLSLPARFINLAEYIIEDFGS